MAHPGSHGRQFWRQLTGIVPPRKARNSSGSRGGRGWMVACLGINSLQADYRRDWWFARRISRCPTAKKTTPRPCLRSTGPREPGGPPGLPLAKPSPPRPAHRPPPSQQVASPRYSVRAAAASRPSLSSVGPSFLPEFGGGGDAIQCEPCRGDGRRQCRAPPSRSCGARPASRSPRNARRAMKPASARPRKASPPATTLTHRELTERYNALVPSALALGITAVALLARKGAVARRACALRTCPPNLLERG
jgi:hypothetical protein